MNLHDYQGAINDFARYPDVHSVRYCALGLFGEAGEIANKVKKIWRDDAGLLTEDRKAQLRDELGDVLWYATRYAHHRGFVVGTFTIELGSYSVIFGDEYPATDIFTATERLSIMAGICVAAAIATRPMDEEEIKDLVGALLNTIAELADYLGTDLEDVAQANVDKLTGRVERGTLSGAGDNR